MIHNMKICIVKIFQLLDVSKKERWEPATSDGARKIRYE